MKRVFLTKSRDAPLCFPETGFGFPTLVRTHATTQTTLKKLLHRCFHVKFAKFLRTPFFTEHLYGCWNVAKIHFYIQNFFYLKNHIYLYSIKKIFFFCKNFVIQRKYIYIQSKYIYFFRTNNIFLFNRKKCVQWIFFFNDFRSNLVFHLLVK